MNQRSVRPRVWPWVIKAVVLAAAYFVVARVGLRYAAIGESISPVWPPTGLALAALLVLGPRYWPAVFFGALLATPPRPFHSPRRRALPPATRRKPCWART